MDRASLKEWEHVILALNPSPALFHPLIEQTKGLKFCFRQ